MPKFVLECIDNMVTCVANIHQIDTNVEMSVTIHTYMNFAQNMCMNETLATTKKYEFEQKA